MSVDDSSHANLPGTRAADMWSWQVNSMDESEGAFVAQEYIQHLIREDPKNLNRILTLPPNQDNAVWVFEHIRQILMELNHLVCILGNDCTSATCPKMVAAKWEFLCAAHKKPQDCCAIDYIIHTLNGFSGLVNNKTIFPSRVRIPQKSSQFFQSIPRRLARVFAHTFYHHRELFDKFEARTFLCCRFTQLVVKFKLLTRQHLIFPIEQLPLPIN